jgi:cytochrome d ubiquinol oxidase subunit I
MSASGVLENQPVKLAAMEGLFETQAYAPMAAAGWVDTKERKVNGLMIPGLLSLLAYEDPSKVVTGLNDLPSDEFLKTRYPDKGPEELAAVRTSYWPNVQAVFQTYHLMISIGMALIGLSLAACFFWWRGWLFRTDWWMSRWLLTALVLSVLGPQIANQAGWFTAEMGRQPWIVYNILKTSQGLSKVVVAEQVLFSIILFTFVYALLFAVFVYLLTRKIHHGPDTEEESEEMPESWKAIIRNRAART